MEHCKILNIYQKHLCVLKHFLFIATNLKSAKKGYRRLPSIIAVPKTQQINICWINEQMNENPERLTEILRNENLYARVKIIMCQIDKVILH